MSRPLLSRVVAVVAPLLVVGGALWGFSLRGPWAPDERILAFDKAMAVGPDVVVAGNSCAANDVDGRRLAALLGAQKVVRLAEAASRGPVHYALLRYRVFEAGYRPRLVLVVSTLRAMLATRLASARELAQLTAHFEAPDDVLATKTLGGPPWVTRIRERRTAFHDWLLDGIKYRTVGVLFGDTGGAFAETTVDRALSEVFRAGALEDVDATRRTIPIVELERNAPEDDLDPGASFLPDMTRLADDHGARIVFVRAPLPPSRAGYDALPPSLVRDTLVLLNAQGAGWVDLTGVPFGEADFVDALHLNAEGRRRFTDALAGRLEEIGALGDQPMASARLPTLPSRVSRTGTPPVLPIPAVEDDRPPCGKSMRLDAPGVPDEAAVAAAGFGPITPLVVLEDGVPLRRRVRAADLSTCSGAYAHGGDRIRFSPRRPGGSWTVGVDPALPAQVEGFPPVWWVHPGTAVRFEFDSPWDPLGGPFLVRVQAAAFGPSDPAAEIAGAGLQAPLGPDPSPAADPTTAGDRVAILEGPAPPSAWSLEIRSPPGGPWLAVRRLSFGEGRNEDVYIGGEPPGMLSLLEGASRFSDNPAPVVETPPLDVEAGVGVFRSEALAAFSDSYLQLHHEVGACSPILVREDGGSTLTPHASRKTPRPGQSSHIGSEIRFRPADGSDPSENGRTYVLAWDPGRTCARRRWLLPGDTLVARARWKEARVQRIPYRGLLLGAVAIGSTGTAGPVHLAVRGGGRSWLDLDIPLQDLSFGSTWPLDEPMPPGTADIEAELRSPAGNPPVVVSKLLLTEDPAPGPAP